MGKMGKCLVSLEVFRHIVYDVIRYGLAFDAGAYDTLDDRTSAHLATIPQNGGCFLDSSY